MIWCHKKANLSYFRMNMSFLTIMIHFRFRFDLDDLL